MLPPPPLLEPFHGCSLQQLAAELERVAATAGVEEVSGCASPLLAVAIELLVL